MEPLSSAFSTSPAIPLTTNPISNIKSSPRIPSTPPSTTIAASPSRPRPSSSKKVTTKQPRTTASPSNKPFNMISSMIDALEGMINTYIDPPLRPSAAPQSHLSGNFAPVAYELPPTVCNEIEGTIPKCLNGAYIRNGPNPRFLPTGPYHPFDGDGMLHCLRLLDGKATLCSRYVKTNKYVSEERAGTRLIPYFISAFNGVAGSAVRGALAAAKMLAWQFDVHDGIGVANTNLSYIGGKLYALCEYDLPYEIRVTSEGDIETLGRRNDGSFDGVINMTAHPKVDPDTTEAFAFRYSILHQFLTYFRFDPHGYKLPDVPISSLHSPTFIHDFAITKTYVVFPDIQIGADPLGFLIGGGSPMGFDPRKVPRLGVMPRYAKDDKDMKWFDVPGFNMFHVANGWDEKDGKGRRSIVVVAPNVLSINHGIERIDLFHGRMEMVRIDLGDNGAVTRKALSKDNLEFPVINPAYVGKKNRYVYAMLINDAPRMTGVVKLDLDMAAKNGGYIEECVVARREYEPGCYGGEVSFVAREIKDRNGDEDDGYLVSYVHDERKDESRFIVIDARSPGLDVVSSVKLPARAPYGFHGLFVKEKDLRGLM